MISDLIVEEAVRRALLEDLGHGHDATTNALVPATKNGKAVMRARKGGVLAGLPCALKAFRLLDRDIELRAFKSDGDPVDKGEEILAVKGRAASILTGERTALNFMTHLSGVASETRRYVEAVKGTKAKIVCTRKTLPGLRVLQKYAVRKGGGSNHRFGLDDGILIKDNHIALAGGISRAIVAARKNAGHMVRIEIEVDTTAQLEDVLKTGGVDSVLLDNMSPDEMREAVRMVAGRIVTQASGNVHLDTVRAIAETGVDLISVGALTHSARALDIGLDIDM
ncbi:MAG: carboxylating nicotinate-nucleotide diphosphorylase [Alphaproteobacteria bacterium]|nr:carboxylating nicotinate-nucleotide diphosphorylase [Alphaproteobacteria bacterium]